MGDGIKGSKSPALSQNSNVNFNQSLTESESPPTKSLPQCVSNSQKNMPWDLNSRKFTIDEPINYQMQKLDSPLESPEEQNMKKRIVEGFKLNPHFIDLEEDVEQKSEENLPQKKIKTIEKDFLDEDELTFFKPFSNNEDLFQREENNNLSSGPIFNLLSQAEKPEI